MTKSSLKIVGVIFFLIFAMSFAWQNASAQAIIDLTVADINSEVKETSLTEDTVTLKYEESGRLLALVPITFTVTVVAHADGTVDVHYPWYSKITIDKETEVEDNLRIVLGNTMRAQMVGSVRAKGESIAPSWTPEQSIEIVVALEEVLQAQSLSEITVD